MTILRTAALLPVLARLEIQARALQCRPDFVRDFVQRRSDYRPLRVRFLVRRSIRSPAARQSRSPSYLPPTRSDDCGRSVLRFRNRRMELGRCVIAASTQDLMSSGRHVGSI